VIQVIDGDYAATRAALREFAAQVEGAEVGLFYYAGHGLQVDGRNYLVPVDAKLVHERELFWQAFGVDFALQLMETAGVAVKLVILDACRDNPLARNLARTIDAAGRSAAIGRGLAPVERVSGTLIAYATAPGAIAEDGSGRNSPFTTALLKWIDAPDLDVRAMFGQVRADVMAATGKKQVPWVSESIVGEFRFRVEIPVVPPAAASTPSSAPAEPGPAAFELAFWNSIADSDDAAAFEEYLKQFPNGRFAGLARLKIAAAQAAAETETAMAGPPAPAIEPVEAAYVAVKNANVRAAPTVRAAKVGRIDQGTKVHVAGKVKGQNWYLVERDDKPLGYVYGALLLPPEDAQAALAPPAELRRPSGATPALDAYPGRRRSGESFRDCAECPEMVVVPTGEFIAGPVKDGGEGMEGRFAHKDEPKLANNKIEISRPFAISRTEITQGQFARFVAVTKHKMGPCENLKEKNWRDVPERNDNLPVACVNRDDALKFAEWLSAQTAYRYELPSETEWEFAARAGQTSIWPWAAHESACRFANVRDLTHSKRVEGKNDSLPCSDGHKASAPVGSYRANAFGLFDMVGNLWEIVKDCSDKPVTTDSATAFIPISRGAAATVTSPCAFRVEKGGSYNEIAMFLRFSHRDPHQVVGVRLVESGFRVKREVDR
jgi:formylglycine-generating enzyme required for sulfatase activity